LVSDVYDGRLRMRPALRRREICIAISAALIAVLGFATAVQLLLLASMRADVASVFLRALALSGLLSLLPLALLWLLERRERQTPWLFAAAFLWGGCIATALALPFNSAFLTLVDTWVVRHPVVRRCCWRRRFPRRSWRRSPRRWACS
jgi:NADH:ubiquinone oxidoreductase subunit 2 (subunit N)